jgi:hypothetical protein
MDEQSAMREEWRTPPEREPNFTLNWPFVCSMANGGLAFLHDCKIILGSLALYTQALVLIYGACEGNTCNYFCL